MAITVCGNCINFGSQTMCIDPAGIYISGRFDFSGCDINPTAAQGSLCGYTVGGQAAGPSNPYSNVIDKFSFSSDGNATDVGDAHCLNYNSGSSSSTHGYVTGGQIGPPSYGENTNIRKWSFTSNGNASDIAEIGLTCASFGSGHTSSTDGYHSGGLQPGSSSTVGRIMKYPFSSDASATCVGRFVQDSELLSHAGQSSASSGYTTGGGPTESTTIRKFPFASGGDSTDVGELATATRILASEGQNSASDGYVSGGFPSTNKIEKFPFSSDGPATDVGELTGQVRAGVGTSSGESGYLAGGHPEYIDTIQKFPFASNGAASDVGELTVGRCGGSGAQF